jgi:hypothetical protein
MSFKAWQLPLRLATGLYILNSGLSKQRLDDEHAKSYADAASSAYPPVADMDPKHFVTLLSANELLVGATLLALPFVSPLVAGLSLLGFSGSLNWFYLKTPGMHEPGSLRPTEQGVPLAKDFWMTSIALALIVDGLTPGGRRR